MNTEIIVQNGSGWNHYPALRGQSLARLLTVSRLAAREHLSRIEVGPRDAEKPLGIAVRFYGGQEGETELRHSLFFDGQENSRWIAARVRLLLEEGIEARRRANRAAADAAAQAAGFTSAADRSDHLAREEERAAREAAAARVSRLEDRACADAAMAERVGLRVAHPDAVRITRKGHLILAGGGTTAASLTRLDGMVAWLHQHGFRASLDDRRHFFAAAVFSPDVSKTA